MIDRLNVANLTLVRHSAPQARWEGPSHGAAGRSTPAKEDITKQEWYPCLHVF